ncbi:MAG: N-acetyltransferase [Sphingomonadales bacterium]|nr:MAG: N-acetyltransferase [Sphingomonadales bacterium]TNF02130.1 MAG: N-acetyltransferase [Sphingomonadales bacterium]
MTAPHIPPYPTGQWRAMSTADLPMISAISDAVHGDYSERPDIYAERLALYPAGCRIFERDGTILGYLISHPWPRGAPPKLNARLGAIPEETDSYYLHDIALMPAARGSGAGAQATAFVLHHAEEAGLREIRLVAVNGADSFWSGQGFTLAPEGQDAAAAYGPGCYLMHREIAA